MCFYCFTCLQDSVDLDVAAASFAPPSRLRRPPHLQHLPNLPPLSRAGFPLAQLASVLLSWPPSLLSLAQVWSACAQARIWRGHPAGETLVKYTLKPSGCQTPPTNLSVRDAPRRHNNEHLSAISILWMLYKIHAADLFKFVAAFKFSTVSVVLS